MCPMRLIPRIFLFDEEELKPELRAQRSLNKQRVPEISRYILKNPKGYTFSALTASVDGKVKFEPLGEGDGDRNLGRLHIPMSARFVINDGQHRRAAIEAALKKIPISETRRFRWSSFGCRAETLSANVRGPKSFCHTSDDFAGAAL